MILARQRVTAGSTYAKAVQLQPVAMAVRAQARIRKRLEPTAEERPKG